MKNHRTAGAAAVLAIFAAIPAAAFHLGLGGAIAAQGAKTADKAASPLPSCGAALTLFTLAPITDPSLTSISPIGHVFPPGHTFPADHGYFNFNESTTAQLGINLYAPSDGWVVQTTYLFGTTPQYYVAFSPCREVVLNILGIASLIPDLSNPSSASSSSCSSFGQNVPGVSGSCVTTMQVPVKAGQRLGTGVTTNGLDFGPLEDTRTTLSGFANPSRHNLNRGFCSLNYFASSVQATYTALLGANSGATFIPRTASPQCGTIVQDVPGTAQGDWYFPGAPNMPDDPHLALIHDNVFPSTATFSVGSSIPGFAGAFSVFPKTVADGSRIDYDFPLVNDGQLYCYDSFRDLFTNGGSSLNSGLIGRIALVQLDSARTALTIELQNPGVDCATAAPWALTGSAVVFER